MTALALDGKCSTCATLACYVCQRGTWGEHAQSEHLAAAFEMLTWH